LFSVVGLSDVFQHTPFDVICDPPESRITPPQVAVVAEISLTAMVSTEGGTGSSLQERIDTKKIRIAEY
jgi:hypothetical protein